MGAPTPEHPDALAAPQANLMASVAKGMFGGHLPWTMIQLGAVIGALVIALDEWLKRRGSSFRVPVLGAAIGIYLPLELMVPIFRSEEHTSELQSLMRISYAVFCLKKKNKNEP